MKAACGHCGKRFEADRIGRLDACPGCGKDLHSCRCCRFHRPGSSGCDEPQARPERAPDRANFCDWFRIRENGVTKAADSSDRDAARDALKKLFGDGI